MQTARYVGSPAVRGATLALALICAALLARSTDGGAPIVAAVVGTGLLAWLGVVHSFGTAFRWWMRFAELLHAAAIRILFGLCYLAVVPLFVAPVRVRDPLRIRRRADGATFWAPCRKATDLPSLERMG